MTERKGRKLEQLEEEDKEVEPEGGVEEEAEKTVIC